MAIDQGSGAGRTWLGGSGYRVLHPSPLAPRPSPPIWLLVFFLTPFLLSCAPVRPVVKIGLIAPFEGLYRHTGYDALSAMRSAIHEAGTGVIDLLPLALDDANDPDRAQRAVQKLLRDQQVRALIGPLTPASVTSVADALAPSPLLWLTPGAITTAGFIYPADQRSALLELIAAVGSFAQKQGAQRLALAGGSGVDSALLVNHGALPAHFITRTDQVLPQDAVFWLGKVDEGAAFLTQLRQVQPQVPFWLGIQGEDPVFTAFTQIRTRVYWASWATSGYDQWAQTHTPATLFAYQVYVATQQAIAHLSNLPQVDLGAWKVRFFSIMPDGSSQPLLTE